MTSAGFLLEDVGGMRLARCAALSSVPGLAHAFSTRIAGDREDFDLGPAGEASPVALRRRAAFVDAAGLGSGAPTILRQVHGAVFVEAGVRDPAMPEADGSFAVEGGGTPAVRTADCVAILLADRHGRAAAAIHAGWRGTAASIARVAVETLGRRGVVPADLIAVLGPAIGPCCYEVGAEVVEALTAASGRAEGFTRKVGASRTTVDLHAANAMQLAAAGVAASAVHRAPWCTRCRNDLFFSVRAEGGAAGRMMAAIGWSRRP